MQKEIEGAPGFDCASCVREFARTLHPKVRVSANAESWVNIVIGVAQVAQVDMK